MPCMMSRERRRARAATALLAALATVPVIAATPSGSLPERFEASFVLSAQGIDIGQTHWQLEPVGGGRYVYRSRSEATGIAKLLRDERIDERSEWRYTDSGGVKPLHYTYSRSGGKRERDVEVRFDWDAGRVHNTLNGQTWSMEVEPGTLDKLVYMLALMQDLADGMRATRYTVADGGKVKSYEMRVVGEERVDTVLGPLDTVIVHRQREGDDERETLVWCAPALGFLPVQVEHREADGTVRLTLTRVEGIAPPH